MMEIANNLHDIKIIGAESLGVRGLCCSLTVGERRIVIDPGLALGFRRKGLLPHPVQIGVGRVIRERIISEIRISSDVVFSHYHGDHIPLKDPNPFQLSLIENIDIFKSRRIWIKPFSEETGKRKDRALHLFQLMQNNICIPEKSDDGVLFFPILAPHGNEMSTLGVVMVTGVRMNGKLFIHASDIQLLSDKAVAWIIELSPDIVLVSGPPLYLDHINRQRKTSAWQNAIRLAKNVETLIIDHHLLRSAEGLHWLDKLSEICGRTVFNAAEFTGISPHLLEAMRPKLYSDIPVPDGWHKRFFAGSEDSEPYLRKAREIYPWFSY